MTSLVSDVMTRNVISVRKEAQFKELVHVMRQRKFSAFPVLDAQDKVIGVVSEDDLLIREGLPGAAAGHAFLVRHAERAKTTGLTAAELRTRPATVIRPEATVAEAAHLMHGKPVQRLPVVTGAGDLVGIVSRVDLLGVYDRPDADISHEIVKQVIEGQFMLDRLAFTVSVIAGVVTLTGHLHRQAVALSLLNAVRQVDGVIAVRDRLGYSQS